MKCWIARLVEAIAILAFHFDHMIPKHRGTVLRLEKWTSKTIKHNMIRFNDQNMTFKINLVKKKKTNKTHLSNWQLHHKKQVPNSNQWPKSSYLTLIQEHPGARPHLAHYTLPWIIVCNHWFLQLVLCLFSKTDTTSKVTISTIPIEL